MNDIDRVWLEQAEHIRNSPDVCKEVCRTDPERECGCWFANCCKIIDALEAGLTHYPGCPSEATGNNEDCTCLC